MLTVVAIRLGAREVSAVSQMGALPCTLYTGELFDNNCAVIIPKNPILFVRYMGITVNRQNSMIGSSPD